MRLDERFSRQDADPPWPAPEPGWRHDAPDPPDAFPVPFTVLDGFGLVLWTIVAQLLVGIPLSAAGFSFDDGAASLAILFGVQVLTLAGALAWLAGRGALSWRSLGPVRPAWRHAAIGIGVGIAGYVIVVLTLTVGNQLFGPVTPPSQTVLNASTRGGLVTALSVLIAVIGAPVLEEYVFRGILFQSLRRKLGLFPALFISALVFAGVHLEVTQPLFTAALLLLGVWLAAAFHRSGSIVVAMFGHATFNAIELTLAYATLH